MINISEMDQIWKKVMMRGKEEIEEGTNHWEKKREEIGIGETVIVTAIMIIHEETTSMTVLPTVIIQTTMILDGLMFLIGVDTGMTIISFLYNG